MTPVKMAEAALAADRAHADPAIWIFRRPDEAVLADAATLEAEGPRGIGPKYFSADALTSAAVTLPTTTSIALFGW